MVDCHSMRLGQIYVCRECGLELKVVAECKECDESADSCSCDEHCDFACCGTPLVLKK